MKVRRSRLFVVGVLAVVVIAGCSHSSSGAARATTATTRPHGGAGQKVAPIASGTVAMSSTPPWSMHPITTQLRLNNGLGTAAFGTAGATMFTSAEEGDSRFAVVSPNGGDPRRSSGWTTTNVLPNRTSVPAAPGKPPAIALEYTTFADIDGDGRPDLLGAQGSELGDGNEPGIRIFWGPPESQVADASAWTDAGRIPSTIGVGHFERVEAADLNGDGVKDLVVGGRTDYLTKRNAGIGWVEAPIDPHRRRDLAAWQFHFIDPNQPGGYGFAVADVNGDGRPDIVLANADSDTPASQRALAWYRNPGPSAIDRPWPKQIIERLPDLGKKTQVAIGDLGDGRLSIVTATPGKVRIYQPDGTPNPTFRKVALTLPPALSGPHERMVKLADIDGDGLTDIVLGFEHDDHAAIPASTAAVAWIGRDVGGNGPWTAHIIRWGAGRTMQIGSFGEKWQIGYPEDVNHDGHTDLVADNQEWWVDPTGEVGDWTIPDPRLEGVGIVWFEQPPSTSTSACYERNGTCGFEAEAPTAQADGAWIERDLYPGAVGGAYIQDFNPLDTGARCDPPPLPNTLCKGTGAGLSPTATRGNSYTVDLDGGRYAIWARVRNPSRWASTPAGAEAPPSAWFIAGANAEVINVPATVDLWTWVRIGQTLTLPAGRTTISLRVREGGIAIDRVALTRNLTNSPPAP
jgi:hypothetical protein